MGNFTARYEAIKQEEIQELREKLNEVGGEYHFGNDYIPSNGEACGGDPPIIACNCGDHPADYTILAICLSSEDNIKMIGYPTEGWEEPQEINLEDVEYGHLQYVTASIINEN